MDKSQSAYGRLFHNRSFVALWLGQTISFIGDYFYWLAIPIMVEKLTGSALQVGLSIMASALPMLLLGPVAGVFVDRWDRKRTMIVADLLRALLVLACLPVKSPDQVWIYYVSPLRCRASAASFSRRAERRCRSSWAEPTTCWPPTG